MDDGLPDEVAAFLDEHIASIEQLEILLLVRSSQDAPWTAEAVSKELYTQADSAAAWLADLTRRGLLREVDGGYRYEPGADCEALVELVATTYAQRRVRVIRQVFAVAKDPASAFADAFRLRKPDKDKS
jgi:hypothetical protein